VKQITLALSLCIALLALAGCAATGRAPANSGPAAERSQSATGTVAGLEVTATVILPVTAGARTTVSIEERNPTKTTISAPEMPQWEVTDSSGTVVDGTTKRRFAYVAMPLEAGKSRTAEAVFTLPKLGLYRFTMPGSRSKNGAPLTLELRAVAPAK
jgi:hypothetical protein